MVKEEHLETPDFPVNQDSQDLQANQEREVTQDLKVTQDPLDLLVLAASLVAGAFQVHLAVKDHAVTQALLVLLEFLVTKAHLESLEQQDHLACREHLGHLEE